MRVLVAIDDSPFSSQILHTVERRSWPVDTQLKVLSVVEPLGPGAVRVAEEEEQRLWLDIERQRKQKVTDMVETACQSLQKTHPEIIAHFEIRTGKAAEQILESAGQWHADCIIVGAHGHSACPHNLPGSVSRKISEQAPCAVEVVRQPVK